MTTHFYLHAGGDAGVPAELSTRKIVMLSLSKHLLLLSRPTRPAGTAAQLKLLLALESRVRRGVSGRMNSEG